MIKFEEPVQFWDREKTKQAIEDGFFEKSGYDLISINDTWNESYRMKDRWIQRKHDDNAAVFLKFHDIPSTESGFTYHTADRIVDFVQESIDKRKKIIVHCYAGISRSAAVAKFINDYWRLGADYLDDYQLHNHWVYDMLLEQAGVPTLRRYYREQEKQS